MLPDALRLCWGCQQDVLKVRRHIGQVCKRRTGEDTILPDSVQLPAPAVSQSCSPIVLRKHDKKRKQDSAGSQMSAPQTEVPVHMVAKTLFHVDVNTKVSYGFLMEAYIRVHLTHSKDRLYGHYKEHARYFIELARTMDEDPELSYKEYTDLKAQLLLEKREEEECKQCVEHREGNVLSALHRCNLVSEMSDALVLPFTLLRWCRVGLHTCLRQ